MGLIERDDALRRLHELLERARTGSGSVALVRGEAGIGKTSVIKQFVADLDDAHVLWGGCDDLMAARPLGPFWDMALDEPSLDKALRADDRDEVFRTVLDLLTRSLRPTVMVIEDMHWADDATLDLVKFVGRRIDRTHGLLLITYRDGESRGDHPLRMALGDLPHGTVERIKLEPLSQEAVRELAGPDSNVAELWQLTKGNPFFVSEALAGSGATVPISIRDAVNTRVHRLSEDAKRLVELASVAPTRIELAVVGRVLGEVSAAIAESEAAGILEIAGNSLKFRHELARRAVEDDLTEIGKRRLNRDALAACEGLGYDVSKCAHHAKEAGDPEAILRILPGAARKAAELESHAEALSTLRALEPYVDLMGEGDRADFYDQLAYEHYLAADRGLEYAKRAIELRRGLGDQSKLANSLLIASRIAWVGTDRTTAVALAEEAAEVTGEVGGDDLARSYSTLSQLAMLGGFVEETLDWGEKALALIAGIEHPIRAHALNNIGAVLMMEDLDRTEELLESRRISRKLNLLHDETRACVNLAWSYLIHKELEQAGYWIGEAMSVTARSEMPSFETYTLAEQAMWHEMRGEWEESRKICDDILDVASSLRTSQAAVSILIAKMAIRSGDKSQLNALIDNAVERAEFSQETQRLGPAYAMVAESLWAGGPTDLSHVERAREVMGWCFDRNLSWVGSEIAMWLTLVGEMEPSPDQMVEPYRLMVDGEWRSAGSWWDDRGLPYEKAVALSLGDVEARLEALEILDGLGAVPLASRIRSALHAEGVKRVPRGPQRATREHDLGLTSRQSEVLELLKEDLTNAEIADRLFISTRTVDHHVSAILTKLGAESRTDAVQLA